MSGAAGRGSPPPRCIEAGFGTTEHGIQRAFADLQGKQVQQQPAQTLVADGMREAQIDRQRQDVHAERRAWLPSLRHRRQRDAAAARAVPGIALHPGDHRAHHGQVDLVIAAVQHLVGVAQRRLAVRAAHRLGDHRLVGIAGQRAPAALATQAALPRAGCARLSPSGWASAPSTAAGWNCSASSRLAELGFKLRNHAVQWLRLKPLNSARISASFSAWLSWLRSGSSGTRSLNRVARDRVHDHFAAGQTTAKMPRTRDKPEMSKYLPETCAVTLDEMLNGPCDGQRLGIPPRRATPYLRRVSSKPAAAPDDLFGPPPAPEAPAGPRPLADRLRPRTLEEVVGQDHLLGPDGTLTRMLARGSLASLILWGPPGVGKTTIARLLAARSGLAFVQLSAVFSGVADLKRAFDEAARRRRSGRRHAAVRRRDPSLQPCPAGRFSAGGGDRHDHADRRHHGEPVLRAERRAAVALPGAGAAPAGR